MGERVKILCVDDDRTVLNTLRGLFMDADHYNILIAESGAAGLAIMEEEGDVRLVISDHRMPERNGLGFLREVNANWPDTIRIVLSDAADTAAASEAVHEGLISKVIPKTWNNAELKTSIAAALEHQSLQSQNTRLNVELQKKNRQLQEINDNLEHMVAQRAETLEIRNRVLQISQAVLDVLPVAVFGIDPEQMIATCNEYARDLFPHSGLGPLGKDRWEVFSPEINSLIDRLETERTPKEHLQVYGSWYRGEVTKLHETVSQGIVLVLVPDS